MDLLFDTSIGEHCIIGEHFSCYHFEPEHSIIGEHFSYYHFEPEHCIIGWSVPFLAGELAQLYARYQFTAGWADRGHPETDKIEV